LIESIRNLTNPNQRPDKGDLLEATEITGRTETWEVVKLKGKTMEFKKINYPTFKKEDFE